MAADGDSTSFGAGVAGTVISFTLKNQAPLTSLDTLWSQLLSGLVTCWSYSGSLALNMGLQGIQ
ncbi:hypothetical protein SBDP1_850028 [Syntrophobacter sp. SbD1]|nr:hypothetical protein SBDP1_850028 [Syntrophobacter sp. SbD1]